MKNLYPSILILLLASRLSAEEAVPAFTQKPTAIQAGDNVKIDFAVNRPTDVAITVEDEKGKIIRHLAAGVLGKNPPEPLQANTLAQTLLWDAKDNFGKTATGGPFKVRVQLGMKPEFSDFVMYNRDGSGEVSAVATGPGGTLYVFHKDGTANENMGGHRIKVYDRDGKHRRVLTPFPADIDPKRVKALGVFQTKEGDLVPHLYNWESLSFHPETIGTRGRDMPEWSFPTVDSKGRVYWLVKGPSLVAVDPDGGIPYDTFLGPKLLTEIKDLRAADRLYWSDLPCLTVSSDDQQVYFAGLTAGPGPDYRKNARGLPCVFRVSATTRGPAEVFVGKLDQPGKEKELLTAPRGIAVANGMLYVADPGSNRIVAFKEADRSYVGEIAVTSPQVVGVDPANGAIYVCAATGLQTADLIKFSGLTDPKEVCRVKLPKTAWNRSGIHRIAVDASAKPVRIWLPHINYLPTQLYCYEDAGNNFVAKGDPRPQVLSVEGPRDLSVDRARGEVYVRGNGFPGRHYRIDAETGKLKDEIDLSFKRYALYGPQLVAGPDGNLYVFGWASGARKGLLRFAPDGKPLNWEGQNTNIIPFDGIRNFQNRGMALRPFAPPEELYLMVPGDYLSDNPKDLGRYVSLNVVGQDGKPRRTVIWQCFNGAVPRLDAKGNIYIADLVKPVDRSYPEFFDGKIPPPPENCESGDAFWYSHMYGSIIKFPPEGGIIWFDKNLPKSVVGEPPAELLAKPKMPFKKHIGVNPHLTGEIQGALWTRFGYAPYSGRVIGNTSHCSCEGHGFDVDAFGRVFFPNAGRFRVEVVDTNNNPITTFGKYGNEDSGGPGATVKTPDIPLAWPSYVAVSDRFAFVADTVNRRVVKVKLGYAAEASCAVP
jgi:outer membrane protein assembly factor BamB